MTARPYLDGLLDVLARAGDRTVLRYGGAGTSASALLRDVHRYARALQGLGIDRGDLVAVYAPNRPQALAVRYGTHLLGAASAFLSAPPDPATRAQMLVDLAPRLVIVFPETAPLLPATTAPVAAIGPVPGVGLRLDGLAAAADPAPLPSRARPADLAVVTCTGGTTGVPKGSMRDFAAWTASVSAPSSPDRRRLACGRLAYLTQVLVDVTLLGGGVVVLQDGFEPASALSAIEAERITDLFLVEPQLFELMDHPDVARRDLGSLRALTHIGASAPPTLRRRARARLGPVIAHTYGASEVGVVSALSPAENDGPHVACSGHIVPGVQVRFRRADGTLATAEGVIEARSPGMAHGYRNRPAEQAANFVDGWYRSGDLGRAGPDGHLRVLGRVADCAQVDGRLVTPTGLQDALCRVAQVRYAEVVADAEAEMHIAAVVPWPGATLDPAACTAAVGAAFGPGVAAGLVVVPFARIPLTEQGKPDRQAIRRRGRGAIARISRA